MFDQNETACATSIIVFYESIRLTSLCNIPTAISSDLVKGKGRDYGLLFSFDILNFISELKFLTLYILVKYGPLLDFLNIIQAWMNMFSGFRLS